ncbi:MAG: hypothetical protein QG555_1217 [Thermodesulfobacteriota bacterium]|nr:hypothetical protein [Thermodesulfobacteriota bacterium]
MGGVGKHPTPGFAKEYFTTHRVPVFGTDADGQEIFAAPSSRIDHSGCNCRQNKLWEEQR